MNEQDIFATTRPHPRLQTLYIIRSILSGPAIVATLPLLLFRYHTMRFKFDQSGITMSWGYFFKSQTTLSYSRIQDIHLESGIIQRWLGLADVQIQTASGSADAEMTIEGILEYEALRDFLYSRMRGYKDMHMGAKPVALGAASSAAQPVAAVAASSVEELELLKSIAAELAGARVAAEKLAARRS